MGRRTFGRFLGIESTGRVPDATTIWRFREALLKMPLTFRTHASCRSCSALVHEGGELRHPHVAFLKVHDREPGLSNKCVDRPIEMAATSAAAPERRQAVLPAGNGWLWSKAMLDEDEFTLGP